LCRLEILDPGPEFDLPGPCGRRRKDSFTVWHRIFHLRNVIYVNNALPQSIVLATKNRANRILKPLTVECSAEISVLFFFYLRERWLFHVRLG
jgi:hypothetical protein